MIQEYFTKDLNELPAILIGTLLMYFSILLFTRIFGLKSFAKMTGFDFLNTIAIGNLLAMSVATSNPKLLTGILLIGILYLVNFTITYFQFKFEKFRNLTDNTPLLLMKEGNFLEDNMSKAKITMNELRGKLREANVLSLKKVRAVVLETTGDVSVLHGEDDEVLDDFLLEEVSS
ncbi:DUF421 domain-containing protein [Aquimarina sp. M1]